jgi:magnesium-protoporphyrin IX monomethyl ester (oxidative) cyclase
MSRDVVMLDFLNKAMSDFDVSLDLGFLTKTRKYIFFSNSFFTLHIFQKKLDTGAILIYRHLERIQISVYTIFRFFESWCQDENRHGDFLLLY